MTVGWYRHFDAEMDGQFKLLAKTNGRCAFKIHSLFYIFAINLTQSGYQVDADKSVVCEVRLLLRIFFKEMT